MAYDPFAGVPAFVAAAERRSFREAAEALGLTPAAISKAISRLEAELGVRLLDHTTRKVEPTSEGKLYLEHCQKALEQIRTARDRVEQARDVAEGELVVALPFILGPTLVELLPEFMRRYPGLRLRLNLSDRISRLVDERIDVALRIGRLDDTTAVARKLMDTNWVTVACPKYLAGRTPPQVPQHLEEHECIVYRSPRGFNVEWSFRTRPHSNEVRTFDVVPRMIVDEGTLLVSAVQSGCGIAQVFTFMVRDAVRTGTLMALLTEYAPQGPPLHALFKPGHHLDPKVRAFVDFCVEKFSALGA